MHLKSFIGGIHPKDQKHHTKDLPIIKLNASDEVVFLLKQHIGAPCKPLVKIKDEVKVGQKIASSVDAAILGYHMYKNGQEFKSGDGLVMEDVEATIQSVGRLGREGMKETNKEIIKI